MTFGPFSVSPAQVESLGGANFTPFVNRLLDTEAAAHAISGSALMISYRDNVADGGVDASLRSNRQTRWLPVGDSAWQFKAGDLSAAKCKAELRGAAHAREILSSGGTYRLVLGKSLTPQKVAKRRAALIEEVDSLGIATNQESIEVLTADSLARWIEQYPALALVPELGSVGRLGLTFAEWAASHHHHTNWTASAQRDAEIALVRDFVKSRNTPATHVEGVSGLGKTRLVLEAMRGQDCESLVVYVPAADSFNAVLLSDLQSQGRMGVIVLDECDAKSHDVYATVLSRNSLLQLITIGEPSGRRPRSPMLKINGLDKDTMGSLLRTSMPGLWPEAARVVVEVASGNVDFALKAAHAVVEKGVRGAGELLTANDVNALLARDLPEGGPFLAYCALALFTRVGFEDEVSSEVAEIGRGLNIPESELRSAASALEVHGLISRQGRYRSVGPHPVALYLADHGWKQLHAEIVGVLLPSLPDDLVERLFRRATELGGTESVERAVKHLLRNDGPVADWQRLAANEGDRLLTHLAVLSPAQTLSRLSDLMESTTDQELHDLLSVRRSLVWALEKLAWSPDTFLGAAELLLRLGVNENETFSNNASGAWVDLFGTMLPTTSVSPMARMDYLSSVAESPDLRVLGLVIRALQRALDPNESVVASGEVQGGTVVAPRGMPDTYEEAYEYRNMAIDLARNLVDHSNSAIAESALQTLLNSIHGSLAIPTNREHLSAAFQSLTPSSVRQVRRELGHLRTLFERAQISDGRPAGVDELFTALPVATNEDRLWELARTSSWEFEDGAVRAEIRQAAERLGDAGAPYLLSLLNDKERLPSSFDIGRALADIAGASQEYLKDFGRNLGSIAIEGVAGYLWALVEAGDADAFDTFIDHQRPDPVLALDLTVRGPDTERARARVEEIVPQVAVVDASRRLFRWYRDAEQSELAVRLEDWLSRLASQDDYNAVVDLAALYKLQREIVDLRLRSAIRGLVAARRRFPSLGSQKHDWVALAHLELGSTSGELVELLVELIEGDLIDVYEGSEERELFRRAVMTGGFSAWTFVQESIAANSWRVALTARGWISDACPPESVIRWIGDDVGKARVVAHGARVGGTELSALVQFLLGRFPKDDKVTDALVGNFISGSWTGPESSRIRGQLTLVEGWIRQAGGKPEVRRWAQRLKQALANRLRLVEQREAEGY